MSRFVLAAAVLGLVVGKPGGTAQAGVIIDINQVGPDVVTTGSGTINLTGLTFGAGAHPSPSIDPSFASVTLGTGGNIEEYSGTIGPTSFGPGGSANADTGTGNSFGISAGIIVVPDFYSREFLSATDTYANQTFSSLGLTPGTYTWTWGTGANADSFTVQIGPVPEPATIVQVGIGGLMGLVYYAWRRRQAKPPG